MSAMSYLLPRLDEGRQGFWHKHEKERNAGKRVKNKVRTASRQLTCSREPRASLTGFPTSVLEAAPLRACAVPWPTRAEASGTCFVNKSDASPSWALTCGNYTKFET